MPATLYIRPQPRAFFLLTTTHALVFRQPDASETKASRGVVVAEFLPIDEVDVRGLVRASKTRTVEGVLGVTSVPTGKLHCIVRMIKLITSQIALLFRKSFSFSSQVLRLYRHCCPDPHYGHQESYRSNFTRSLRRSGTHQNSPSPPIRSTNLMSMMYTCRPATRRSRPHNPRLLCKASRIRVMVCGDISSLADSFLPRAANGISAPGWGRPIGFKRKRARQSTPWRRMMSDSFGIRHSWRHSSRSDQGCQTKPGGRWTNKVCSSPLFRGSAALHRSALEPGHLEVDQMLRLWPSFHDLAGNEQVQDSELGESTMTVKSPTLLRARLYSRWEAFASATCRSEDQCHSFGSNRARVYKHSSKRWN